MKAIEHELEVIVRVHEVRSEYERQIQEYVSFTLRSF
jgi:kinesin family protein 4/21/27